MKFIALILTIFLFSLLAYPCHDDICDNHSCKEENTVNHKQSHDEQNCHTCSPFCICGCCQTTTITSVNINIKPIVTTPTIYLSEYKESLLKEFSKSIWEPPKV